MSFVIDGLTWRENWRVDNGQDSYVVPFPHLRPSTIVFHGEAQFAYGHYGIHLGQADQLTFLGPSTGTITGHFIDTRAGSRTAGTRESHTWNPTSAQALYIPPGVAHTFDGLEGVDTINSYELFLPDPKEWVHGDLKWQPDADIINLSLDVTDEELPYFTPNSHPASQLWYDLVATQQRAMIPRITHEYPVTREMKMADGSVRRIELRKRLDERTLVPQWAPVAGIPGLGWVAHPVVHNGPESGFAALLERSPLYCIDHGETGYSNDAYGIHLGQEDRLTFLGPRSQQVTVHFIDTRSGSPTFGRETSYSFTPDPQRFLLIPPGVGHAFESIENVYTVNRPRTLLPADGRDYRPGNDVIDWPKEKRPIPELEPHVIPAPKSFYEQQAADQAELRKQPNMHGTPAVMMVKGPDGKYVRVAMRKKQPTAA
jgi:dTDP-4-dehydrorhamnose 3,5-epimerase-like enzyme